MLRLLVVGVLGLAAVECRGQEPVAPTRIYQTDAYGRIRADQPSWQVLADGRIIEVDAYGHPQYHRPGYRIQDDRVYATDAYGRLRRDAPVGVLQKPKP